MTEVIVPAPDLNAIEPPDPTLVAPVVPAAPVVPELRYEYQPTDEHGRALGGKQVIVYRTSDELADKLRDQNVSLVRKLREVTKNNRLGRTVQEDVPADAERLPADVEFKEIPLTPDERFQLSQDLVDPTKFDSARDRLFKSAMGVDPKEFREQQNQQQFTVKQLLARTNAVQFIEQTPEFYVCEENLEYITDWMIKNKLQPTVRNFQIAYSTAREAGLLSSPPIVREDAPVPVATAPVTENTVPNITQVPVEPAARISNVEQPQHTSQPQVPSGLNSRRASNTGVIPASGAGALTLADIDKMSSDEYKRRVTTDPEFVKQVNDLEAKRPPRPRRA